jgi:hypothetical protein
VTIVCPGGMDGDWGIAEGSRAKEPCLAITSLDGPNHVPP